MMIYRTYLFDPTVPRPERPVVAFFVHIKQAEDWARKQLEKAGDNSEVWLYKVEEILQGSYKKMA